jgi:hypothetical protein
MYSRTRLALITLGLAACGAVAGAACAIIAVSVALITHSRGALQSGFAPPPLLLVTAVVGAAIGTVAAPALSFAVLRRVPLGRAILVTAIGTIAGAVIGELVAPLNPYDADLTPGLIRGALIGFTAAGLILRLTVSDSSSSKSLDQAV